MPLPLSLSALRAARLAATLLTALLTAGLLAPASVSAATRTAPVRVLAFRADRISVANLDRSFAFYRDVLGLPVEQPPHMVHSEEGLQRLLNTPAARIRSASFHLPGSALDLVLEEISGTGTPALRARTTPRPRLVDPGAALLLLRVRSLGPVLAAAERAGTQRPARDSTNLVLVDPDGIFISVAELSEGSATDPVGTATNPATNAPAAGNVLSAEVAFTIAAPPTLMRFYRDVLGLAVRTGPFERTGSLEQLLDAPRALVAFAQIGAVRGSIGVLAFKGVPRHTYLFRPQDPGATAVTLEVSDLAAALRRVRSVGALVISAGGQPVASPNGEISILIRDPDGLLLQLQQATQLQPAQRQRAARPDPSPP